MPPQPSLTYDTVLFFWRIVINIFFREIRPRGAWNIPKEGPVIFVAAPHHNQFLDPLLLASEARREAHRQVGFLAAAHSMRRRVVGKFISLLSSIPVERAQDAAKAGPGFVRLSPSDPCLVIGVDTKFTSSLEPRMKILLPKSTGTVVAEVQEVISDTEVRMKKEFMGDQGKGTARVRQKCDEAAEKGEKGLTYKIVPHIDQEATYGEVYRRLKEGGCIGIFPEGGSHDRTDLLPLKAGVAIMALGAMANHPDLRVRIVPVGLSYFHAHRFRSRAVVEFGSPMDVPQELVDLFQQGGDNKRLASGKLLDMIYDGLKTVTVRAPDMETLMLIQAGRRLYKTPGQHLTLGQVVELNRRFIEGYMHFKDEPRIQKLKADVIRYNRSLKDLGLKDHQVPLAKRVGWKTLGLLTYRVGLLTVWSAFALPGVILNSPIFITASIMSRKKAKEALAASTVKIQARDVLATWKVLISLGLAPLVYGLYSIVATIIVSRSGAPMRARIWTPFLVMAALPFIGFSALKFGEAGLDVLKSLRPLIVALLPGQQRSLNRLKAMREQIANELNDVINEFGPKLYEDFDEFRILVPSSSAPPSTGTPGIWRRKSGVGGVDAQGNLLVHPMTWLDERLFGWSHSARRYHGLGSQSATTSRAASSLGTPEGSDTEEEIGDYDNVLGYLHSYEESLSRTRSRSHHASYADLQQLRKKVGDGESAPPSAYPSNAAISVPSSFGGSAGRSRSRSTINLAQLAPVYHKALLSHPTSPEVSMPPSPVSDGGLHLRRERRSSLTSGVSVERIGALSPLNTFKEGTQDLNRENEVTESAKDR